MARMTMSHSWPMDEAAWEIHLALYFAAAFFAVAPPRRQVPQDRLQLLAIALPPLCCKVKCTRRCFAFDGVADANLASFSQSCSSRTGDGSKGRDGLRHKADNHKIAERVVGQLGTEKNRRETLIGYIRNISWG